MKNLSAFAVLLFLTLALSSCDTATRRVSVLMDRIETILEQNPDSALLLLDSIGNPDLLKAPEYNRYVLLSMQTKDKTGQDIRTDTTIFQARDHFQEKNDLKYLALAELYCGRVRQEQNDTSAIIHYQKAIDCSEEDKLFKAALYKSLSDSEKKKGNIEKSFSHYEQYSKTTIQFYRDKENTDLLKMREQYKNNLLESANKQQKLYLYLITTVSILAIGIALILLRSSRNLYKKIRSRNYELNEKLDHKEEEFRRLSLEMNKLKETQDSKLSNTNQKEVNRLLLAYFDETYDMIELVKDNYQLKNTEINNLFVNSVNWNHIFQQINQYNDDFVLKLERIPGIDDSDIQMFCLYKIGFMDKKTSNLYPTSEVGLRSKRKNTRIKMKNLGIDSSFLYR